MKLIYTFLLTFLSFASSAQIFPFIWATIVGGNQITISQHQEPVGVIGFKYVTDYRNDLFIYQDDLAIKKITNYYPMGSAYREITDTYFYDGLGSYNNSFLTLGGYSYLTTWTNTVQTNSIYGDNSIVYLGPIIRHGVWVNQFPTSQVTTSYECGNLVVFNKQESKKSIKVTVNITIVIYGRDYLDKIEYIVGYTDQPVWLDLAGDIKYYLYSGTQKQFIIGPIQIQNLP